MAIEVFNRREIKYLISNEDKEELLSLIEKHNYMDKDSYNQDFKPYKICNLYLDSQADELIIRSLEKPVFKEKIRLRSYGTASLSDIVFLESKKKYKQIVNKRRTSCYLQEAYDYFEKGIIPSSSVVNTQVMKEIDYIMNFYKLEPKVFISYDRLAFFEKNNSDFRLTIDTNIQTRRNDLRLDVPAGGNQLLQEGKWLMEAKAFNAFPLWFVHFLSEHKIFNTSFSKYGTEFTNYKKTIVTGEKSQ